MVVKRLIQSREDNSTPTINTAVRHFQLGCVVLCIHIPSTSCIKNRELVWSHNLHVSTCFHMFLGGGVSKMSTSMSMCIINSQTRVPINTINTSIRLTINISARGFARIHTRYRVQSGTQRKWFTRGVNPFVLVGGNFYFLSLGRRKSMHLPGAQSTQTTPAM